MNENEFDNRIDWIFFKQKDNIIKAPWKTVKV